MLTTGQIQQILDAQNQQNFSQLLTLCDDFLPNNSQNPNAKAFLLHAKGIAFYYLNQHPEAISALRQAQKLNPNDQQILANFAMILTRGSNQVKDWLQAQQILENLYKHNSQNSVIICRLAVVFWRLGKWQLAKKFSQIVVENFQNATNPSDYSEMLSCLAQSCIELKEFDYAKSIIKILLKDFPNADGHLRNGELLMQTNQKILAISELETACQIQPENFHAWDTLISAYNTIGECETASKVLEKFLPRIPKNKYLFHFAKHLQIIPYCDFATCELMHEKTTKFAKLVSEQYTPKFTQKNFHEKIKKNFRNLVEKSQKSSKKLTLKIGLVSADLRFHAVSFFLLNLFKALQQRQQNNKSLINIEFFAYSNSPIFDETSKKIQRFCKKWTPIFDLDDEAVAKKIYADNINILFDLSGITIGHRLYMFALRPAPIQISWIGWLGTTGIPTMDYFLADEFCVPNNVKYEQQFSEKVLRMPHIWEVLTPPNVVISQSKSNKKYTTFGSFNNPNKVGAKTLDLWSEILRKSPENTEFLWLRGDFVENAMQEKFLNAFKNRGVNIDKILLKPYETYEKYLQTLGEVDLILDSYPFSGMTTTSEALTLGTPTITLLGNLMSSRLSGSCINAIGDANLNKNFIFDNENDFINQAIFFAENPAKLNELKNGLAEKARKSPLCDAELFAKNFEIKMHEVWLNFLNS